MLSEIVESKKESEVYGFFLVMPRRAFSLFELVRRLHGTYASLQLVLSRLVKLGYLKSFTRRGKKYYIVNSKVRMFEELQLSLIKNQKNIEDELYVALKKLPGVKAAFLSGLFTGKPELPVDLLLVGNVSNSKLEQFIANLERMMEQEINYTVLPVEEFIVRRNTFDRFIKDIFDYSHLVVFDNSLVKEKKLKKKN